VDALKALRSVDVQPRSSVYASIEVYSMVVDRDGYQSRDALIGTAFFFLFDDAGRLRTGCWKISLTGEYGTSLQFRVMDGRASSDAQRT
jgi:hypothetical protein